MIRLTIVRSIDLSRVRVYRLAGVLPALAALVFAGSALGATSFGAGGSGNGQFKEPSGVAVNESSGEVYVVDSGNNRVEIFSSEGLYLGQFNGSETPAGSFAAPTAIAVDNYCVLGHVAKPLCDAEDPSAGDVYVTDTGHHVIDKYTPEGKYLGQITGTGPSEPFAGRLGVAVDGSGRLWVEEESGNVDRFSDLEGNPFLGELKVPLHLSPGIVVRPSDAYVIAGGDLRRAEAGGGVDPPPMPLFNPPGCRCDTAVAIDLPSGDVYIAENTFAGRTGVSRYAPNGKLIAQVAAEKELVEPTSIAVSSSTGTLYVADAGADVIRVYGPPRPSSDPIIESESGSAITENDATLEAWIDTEGEPSGAYYQFQLVKEPSEYRAEIACPLRSELTGTDGCQGPEVQGSVVGYLPTKSGSQTVSVDAAALGLKLEPGVTYHYRVLAATKIQTEDTMRWETPPIYGPDQTFTTVSKPRTVGNEPEKEPPPVPARTASAPSSGDPTPTLIPSPPGTVAPAGFSTAKPKPLSRAQMLARALKQCKREPKRKRAACIARAKRKYAVGGKKATKRSRTG